MRILATLFGIGMTLAILGGIALLLVLDYYSRDLPDYEQLADYEPPMVTRLYAADGRLMAEYATEKRTFLPISAVPKRLINAFLSAEDRNFYSHPGIDFIGVARAAVRNIRNVMEDRRLEGGSSITQQVVKNFLLSRERTLDRKIKEAILAFRINKAFSKDRILELYLNDIYLGYGSYGVASAALNYFNKSIDELTIEEAAFLAALPKAPAHYNPKRHPERAKERRDWVISRMHEDGHITQEEAEKARETPIILRDRDETEMVDAEYFAEEVRRELIKRYDSEGLYEGGYVVRTTMDPVMQRWARNSLRQGLMDYDRRHGYRGTVSYFSSTQDWQQKLKQVQRPEAMGDWELAMALKVSQNGVQIGLEDGNRGFIPFEEMKWAREWLEGQFLGPRVTKPSDVLRKGDVILVERIDAEKNHYALVQVPEINGAIVAMDPHTGRVLAMVGGFSFEDTEFNRAVQAMRQPGSAFKPFVYLAAILSGFSPASIIVDAPVEIDQGPGLPKWKPQNYSEKFYGPTPLRKGLEKSRNAMTVNLALQMGLERVIEVGKAFGIYNDPLPTYSYVLGAQETTLMRLTAAYASLVNGGLETEPALIERIQDRNGTTIYRRDDRECQGCQLTSVTDSAMVPPVIPEGRERIIDAASAYQMVSMLEGVVQRGTGRRAKRIGKPLAGKTGTTNNSFDAWFIGFSPDLVVGVYTGFDKPHSLGERETGSSVALPIFISFMEKALEDKPSIPFRIPPGITLARIDSATGQPPTPSTPKSRIILEAFKSGVDPYSRNVYGIYNPVNQQVLSEEELGEQEETNPISPQVSPPPSQGTGGLY